MAISEEPRMNTPLRLCLRFLPTFGCLVCMALLLLAPTLAQADLNITTTPQTANISPGAQSPVQLLYSALETDFPNASYTATSVQGRFETLSGDLLGTLNRSVTITIVNSRGTATELVMVPANVTAAAMKAKASRIVFRRIFQPSLIDHLPGTMTATLQIVPSPAGQFALIGLQLEFNQPAPSDAPRPGSGERITVPRNTKGLRAAAIVTYNGQGLLRGRPQPNHPAADFLAAKLIYRVLSMIFSR